MIVDLKINGENNLSQTNEVFKPTDLVKAFENETRSKIFFYLQIYHELTLQELVKLTKKSSTAVHHHLQILLNSKIITENTKSGSKTKYYRLVVYRLDKNITEHLKFTKDLSQEELINNYKMLLNFSSSLLITAKNVLESIIDFYELGKKEDFYKDKDITELFETIFNKNIVGIYHASTENAVSFQKEFRKLLFKYYDKELEKPERPRPYTFVLAGANMKTILEEE